MYPVFENFEGWRFPEYEGGQEESSSKLVAIVTNQNMAKLLVEKMQMKANRDKLAYGNEVSKYESKYEFKEAPLNYHGDFWSSQGVFGEFARFLEGEEYYIVSHL